MNLAVPSPLRQGWPLLLALSLSCSAAQGASAQNSAAVQSAAAAQSPAVAQFLATARASARAGNIDQAVVQARQAIASRPRNPEAHELLCNLQGSIQQFDAAIRECETAQSLQPGSSLYALQLARVYGAKADHAGALTGIRMVGRIRDSFERAAQLDPRSVDALSDLGEFYVEAPGFVGGGTEKAASIVGRLQPLSPARAHRLAAMVAAKSGDTAKADEEYAAELAAGHTAEAYVDLANYDRKRKLWDEAAKNAASAIERDTEHGPDTVDAAKLLVDIKRDYPAAIAGLRAYLATAQQTAVMAAPQAHTLLGQALEAGGDGSGAQAQYRAALALAGGYEPAQKAVRR